MATKHQLTLVDAEDGTQAIADFHGGSCIAISRACPGHVTNEDSCLALQINEHSSVLVVADGAGGYSDGASASKLVVETLQNKIASHADTSDLRLPIIEAIQECNTVLQGRVPRAASTVVVAELQGRGVRHYLVGDSSIYVVGQRGVIRLQSVPQSVVGYGIESGFLPENAAQEHEERHLVLNLIGIENMKIELGSAVTLRQRDTILICSDGLTDNLPDEEIINTIRCGKLAKQLQQLQEKASKAMQAENGHPDDLTLVAWRPN